MKRRTLTPARKKRIANGRGWRVAGGDLLCLEAGQVHLLATGGPVEFDHIHPLADGGGNEDDNFQPMAPKRHKAKTRDDAKARGKVRRLSGQTKKRKYHWPTRTLGIPGLRKMLNGRVERTAVDG